MEKMIQALKQEVIDNWFALREDSTICVKEVPRAQKRSLLFKKGSYSKIQLSSKEWVLGRLRELSVVVACHFPVGRRCIQCIRLMYFKVVDLLSDFDKYRLNALASIPFSKYSEIVWIYISIQLVHEREIDARKETYDRWFIRVFFAALNLQTVDAVLMYGLIMHIDRC